MSRPARPSFGKILMDFVSPIVLFLSIFLYLCSGKVIAIFRRLFYSEGYFIRFEVYNIQSAAVK